MLTARCAGGVKPIRQSTEREEIVRWIPILESSRVKGKGQDNRARAFKEPYASTSARPAYPGLIGRRCASLGLHMWRGCRSLTYLHGTHQATGVQVPPKLPAVVFYVERDNPAIPPDAMSGRHYRKACCWKDGRKMSEEANVMGKSHG